MAHIESIGTLYNDKQEVGGGSGLLIGDKFVLTNNHLIPPQENYRTLTISVRLRSRLLNPLGVQAVTRDADHDLALLELKDAVGGAGGSRCPMPVAKNAKLVPMGSAIFIMGFPLDRDLSITDGLISNQSGGNGRWQTNALINPGNSGGPAFDIRGAFVGLAVGGVVKWTFGDQVQNVIGVNFIIPAATIIESPLYATIEAVPGERRCWTEATPSPSPASLAAPSHLNRNYSYSETKDDHPVVLAPHSRNYEKSFQAEPGYHITKCTWNGFSENHQSDVLCNIQPGGKSALLTFRLTSGPMVDRWRGWLTGAIALEQERDS